MPRSGNRPGHPEGVEAQLYGVELGDPGVLVIAVALLGTVAVAACAFPARRATLVDPVAALTRE